MRSTVFDAAFNNDVATLQKLKKANQPYLNLRYDQQKNSTVYGNFFWYGKRFVTVTGLISPVIMLAILPASGPVLAGSAVIGMMGMLTTYGDTRLARSAYDKTNWTPLHFTAVKGAKEAAAFLILGGADIALVDSKGRDFLKIAEELGNKEFIAYCDGIIQTKGFYSARIEKLEEDKKNLTKDNRQYIADNTQLRRERNEFARLAVEYFPQEEQTEDMDEKKMSLNH